MTKQEKEKLIKFREWLISKTEKCQGLACQPKTRSCGRNFHAGIASGFIQAKSELEKIFGLWD